MLKTLAAALIATSLVAGPVLAAQGTTGPAASETAPAPKVHKKHHVRHHARHNAKHVVTHKKHVAHKKHVVTHKKHVAKPTHHRVAKVSKTSKADR